MVTCGCTACAVTTVAPDATIQALLDMVRSVHGAWSLLATAAQQFTTVFAAIMADQQRPPTKDQYTLTPGP